MRYLVVEQSSPGPPAEVYASLIRGNGAKAQVVEHEGETLVVWETLPYDSRPQRMLGRIAIQPISKSLLR